MKRKPTAPRAPAFATFTPKPEPMFELGHTYTLADGAKVSVKMIEWLKDKWIYYLTKHTESRILRFVSVITQAEFVDLTARKAMVA